MMPDSRSRLPSNGSKTSPVSASAATALMVKSLLAKSSSRLVPEAHLGVAAPPRVQIGPVGRDLDDVAPDPGPDRPEALSDGPQMLRPRPEEVFDLLRMGIGRRVYVRVRPTEQPVPHVPADQVQLVPGLPERLTETRERLRNLQPLYLCHYHVQILVPMKSKSRER